MTDALLSFLMLSGIVGLFEFTIHGIGRGARAVSSRKYD